MEIALDGCHLWTESYESCKPHSIAFSLPGVINLYGIKPDINPYQCEHERFQNIFGTLSLGCDYCIRYFPPSDANTSSRRDFRFRSLHAWPDFKGRDFTMFDMHQYISKYASSDKDALIGFIYQHEPLRTYLESFFHWINESIIVYGAKFFISK